MDFLKIGKLLQDFYAVPDYQRDYEWTNIQNSTLIDDVMSLVKGECDNHFIGAIVTIPYDKECGSIKSIDFEEYSIDEKSVKHVVDGQQRLTSCTVLIQAIIDSLNEETDIDSSYKENNMRMLQNIIAGSAFNDDSLPAPHLILNGNTGRCYNKEIIGIRKDDFDKKYKGAKRLSAALKLYKSEIKLNKTHLIEENLFRDNKAFYQALIKAIKDQIFFVEIACDESSDAFQVFDSLNGKGLDLTAADRIKNILLSWTPKNGMVKWDALVQEIGESHLSSFFLSLFFYKHKKRVPQNKLPDMFKSEYKNLAQNNYPAFWNELNHAAKMYGFLRKCEHFNANIISRLQDVHSLKQEQIYVLLFAAAMHYGEETINKQDFASFLDECISLIVRMHVSEKNMNKLDSIFSKWISAMCNDGAKLPDLTEKIHHEKITIVPDDTFESTFAQFTPTESKVEDFYLRHLEGYLRKQSNDRDLQQQGAYTVEHIIPQTLTELSDWYGDEQIEDDVISDFKSYIENIGNKALLYQDDNSAASNTNYESKKDVYRNGKKGQNNGTPEGTFKLIQELLKDYPDKFTHNEVKLRAQKLAAIAKKIW